MKRVIDLGVKGANICRLAVLISVGMVALSSQAYVQTIQLANGNSSALVDVGSTAGMYNWTVDGVNQLAQQWFWFRTDSVSGESALSTLPYLATQPAANQLSSTYTASGFNVRIDYSLTGGSPGSATADILENIVINNTSSSLLHFHFFQYSDFDLGGNPLGDTVTINYSGTGYDKATQTKGGTGLSEVIDLPEAIRAQAGTGGTILGLLNDGLPTTLNNNLTATGDANWAFEWEFDIQPGGSEFVVKDKHMAIAIIPEPGVLSLLALGLGAFALRRQRA